MNPSDSENVIEASQLTRRFNQLTAVNQLDLSVSKGSIYGFLGPNGSGKTTAIRMLTGLLSPSSGHISILGLTLPRDAEKLRQRIGYMTQQFSLYGDLTITENLQFIAKIYGLKASQRKQRIKSLLSTYDLEHKASALASSMSGGQRQRLALAAATLHHPELLFLDEPTSAVDPENRRDFWEKLFDLCDEGTTILVSTHYMDEAERCHQLAILESGIKRADGSPARLMQEMNAQVIEVDAPQLRQLKQQLLQLPDIISAAQLGARLRVLVNKKITHPIEYMMSQTELTQQSLQLVRPSLEDVFVTCTGTQSQ